MLKNHAKKTEKLLKKDGRFLELSLIHNEEWKTVLGFEGWYSISNFGRLRRDKCGRHTKPGLIQKHAINEDGYHFVRVCKNGIKQTFRVNVLVALHFIGPRPPKEDLELYHAENPKIYEALERFTFEAIRAGRKYFGGQGIIERVRWFTMIESKEEMFKVNNNLVAYYSRLFEEKHPEHKGFFRKRRSVADKFPTSLF